MSEALVLSHFEPTIGSIMLTINRPDKRNALNRELIGALTEAFAQADADPRVRSVILTGAGKVFCAGMDLAELQSASHLAPEETPVWEDALRLAQLYDQIYRLSKPTIAAINGPALAGGAGLVSVCDLALTVPEAKFGYPEVRLGLVAALVMPHLLRHVGERLARYLLLTGEIIHAEQALQAGLINEIAPSEELLTRASEWAELLARGGPQALQRTKELLAQFSCQALSVELAAQASAAPRLTEECRQAVAAFFAKQPSPWAPRLS